MANPGRDDGPLAPPAPPVPPALERVVAGGRRRAVAVGALAALALGIAAVVAVVSAPGGPDAGGGVPAPPEAAGPATPSDGVAPAATSSTTPAPSSRSPGPRAALPTASPRGDLPPPVGRIAVVDRGGALAIVDDRGGGTVTVDAPGIGFGAPAWSPDGARVAAIGTGPEAAGIYLVDVPLDGPAAGPAVIYESADRPPFYLYWSPDGERIAFLATEGTGITLRTAPADGTEPADGPDADGILREGAPLYYAWEDASRLLVHIGTGADAFTGELDLAGAPALPLIDATGEFRPAVVSPDGTHLAYVMGDAGAGDIVVQARDGSGRHTLAVLGPAALAFDPSGTMLATIAADRPAAEPLGFPFGPLRLIDTSSGAVRTLIDDSVVASFWSPDGRTIAALRVAPAGGSSAAAPGVVLAAATAPRATAPRATAPAAPDATPEPAVDIRVTFVDVDSGAYRSDRSVRLGDEFVGTVLPYFDQYALSHRLWAPDSSAIVLPLKDPDGVPQAMVLDADGADDRAVAEAALAFWAP